MLVPGVRSHEAKWALAALLRGHSLEVTPGDRESIFAATTTCEPGAEVSIALVPRQSPRVNCSWHLS